MMVENIVGITWQQGNTVPVQGASLGFRGGAFPFRTVWRLLAHRRRARLSGQQGRRKRKTQRNGVLVSIF
jgi:hypothetical protein